MAEKEWFKDWFSSPYYHLLYFEHGKQEAAAFIDKLVDHLKPASNSLMLDVACGKGRHSILLAEKGFVVSGIDLSIENITVTKQFEKENLHFYQHDMRMPFWVNYFDYAFNFFTSFGYFKTKREHDNSIRTMANAIKEDGILMIDYLNVHYAENHLIHKLEKQVNGINYFITKWFDETHFYKKIVVEDDALEEPVEHTERVAKFSLGDFTEMMAYQGVQVQEVFGDYQLSRYDVINSPRMIVIGKKIKR
ncbi:MAG: class I SAM-dependent methyltransferase [Sphingobacteriales bacterium]|nr:class I SAM-dependent methyltransferase [Sphingobacteriales bacterium]MBI3718686.1 class I SAM-dependent methyltransferase [Sphingobacteriales bacterium]